MLRIFIVSPSASFPEDTRYDVCKTTSREPLSVVYDSDKYEILASLLSEADAVAAAKKHGSKRPTII